MTRLPRMVVFPAATREAWRDGLTMAYLVPERFQEMVTRAVELGDSRIIAGMHSPLDVMSGRMLGTAAVVYNLNSPENAELKQARARSGTLLAYEQVGGQERARFGSLEPRGSQVETALPIGQPMPPT